jgi:6-pyruvoyltetrahydropterin/6-carboxytetrahydropterin synthase
MGWRISKEFNFAYGHRVHAQVLDSEFALDRQCVCRHLHGHEAEVHVHLEGANLNPQGMVVDFVNLSWLKKFFDETVDHKFILDINDPLFENLVHYSVRDVEDLLIPIYVPETNHIAGHLLDVKNIGAMPGTPEAEYYESFFIVNFIPTSENLSKWVYDLVTPKMARIGVKVGEVEWWETKKSCARYSG